MRNLTIYASLTLCLIASKMVGQETFEKRAKDIAIKIENITNEEKETLKKDVDGINSQLQSGSITLEQADFKKQQLAQARATSIENRVALVQEELRSLVQEKVDGKINDSLKLPNKRFQLVVGGSGRDNIGNTTEINLTTMKTYRGQMEKEKRLTKRTTSQFVFAAGINNVVTNGNVTNSDFRYWGSHFYEWGLTYNTRILKNQNLLHFKYGFSVMYNNLRATENRIFVVNGNQTSLEVNPISLDDSRFKNVNLVFPVHLEFDFTKPKSKDGKTYFKTHESFRLGLGGYLGTNLKSKQYINYTVSSFETETVTKADFNSPDLIYGLSGYLGYGATSLYLKYDLNPLFASNLVKQNNVSLGFRFDFN